MLEGILPVLPTPFDKAGGIDAVAMKDLVSFAIDSGASGLVYPGFASEVAELTDDERSQLLEVVARQAQGRACVIAGATASTADEVVDHARHAQSLGLRHIMVQPPIELGSGLAPVLDFFARIADGAPDMQIILQNAPAPRGSDLQPRTIEQIAAALPRIAYVKEESLPAGPGISHLVANGPESLRGVIGGGGARYILDEYSRGACAAMPALEIADLHADLDRAWRADDRAKARRIYVATLPLLALQAVYRMRLTKHVLVRRGVLENPSVRAAAPELDAAAIADIDANLAELGLLGTGDRARTRAA